MWAITGKVMYFTNYLTSKEFEAICNLILFKMRILRFRVVHDLVNGFYFFFSIVKALSLIHLFLFILMLFSSQKTISSHMLKAVAPIRI